MSGGGSSGAGAGGEAEVSSTVLSAPPGWTKKVTTPLKGGTPKRKEIIFVAPTGEELSSKKQVEKYLKSHPGGPELSEFYWGSGETPRRSSRLSVKTKEVDTPESEPPKKQSRKSLEKKGDDTETEAALEVEQGDDDTPESEPPKKRGRKSLEKKGDDTETEAALEVEQGDDDTPESEPPKKRGRKSLEKKGDDTETEAALEVEQGDDVQMHDTEVAVTEKTAEVKAVDAQETPALNSIDDLRAPVAPFDGGNVVKESMQDDSVETRMDDDTVAEGTKEEIPISEHMPLSGDTQVAVEDDTKNEKAPEDPQVKVDMNVQEDASKEQRVVKVDCPEVVVGEKDVACETEHVGWTREIQVEDGNSPSSALFDEKKVGNSGPISEVTAADPTPKVNAEDGEVKPQAPHQMYAIDLEQLPAP